MPRRIRGNIFEETIRPIDGGLNLSVEEDQLALDEFPHLLNWDTRERGVLKTRGGSAKVLSSLVVANATSLVPFEFHDGSDWYRGVIVSDGATIYKVSGAAKTELATGKVSGSTWRGSVYNGKLYLCNGLNAPMVWDGTTMRRMGIIRPAFTPTEVHTASGALSPTGDGYAYKFSYYDSTNLKESSPGANEIAATGSFTSKKVVISGLSASGQTNVDKIRIYRTIDGGTAYYRVNTIDDTETTYDDEMTDAVLVTKTAMVGAIVDADGNPTNDIPPSGTMMVAWQERLWTGGVPLTGESNLGDYSQCNWGEFYYSNITEPEYWRYTYAGAALGQWIGAKREDAYVQLLAPFGDQLCLCVKKAMYNLQGIGETGFRMNDVATLVGAQGPDSFDTIGPHLIRFATSPAGVYEYDGARTTSLSYRKLDTAFNPPAGDSEYFEADRYDNICVAYNKPANQTWMAISTDGASVNDRILVLQHGAGARWTMFDHQAVKICCARGVHEDSDTDYMYGIDRFGFLWRYDVGELDGVPSGTQSGTAESATSTTLTDDEATFYTTGDGLKGVKVRLTGGTGDGQTRYISSNTGTALTVESTWTTNPDDTTTYEIGAIDTELKTRHIDFGGDGMDARRVKKFRTVTVEIDHGSETSADTMTLNTYVDAET